MARATRVSVLESDPFFEFHEEVIRPVETFRLVLMRKDPPVDVHYLYATQLLSLVSKKTCVINDPQALRDWNEKLMILNFPDLIPKTLVSHDKRVIDSFIQARGGTALLKPLEGFGGHGVRKIVREIDTTPNRPVMVQEFLPEVAQGEKRIFFVNGKVLGALLKLPPEGGFITNPDLGGRVAPTSLSEKEKRSCSEIASFLKKKNIFFAGVDMIGGKLTEINITSPGLLWEWNEVDNRRHEEEIVTMIERRFL